MFVRIENLKVHYKVSGTGAPIILIHGWGSDISYFSKLSSYLAQKFTVYALDLPGFGLSVAPQKIWGSIDYADLVKKFIGELKIIQPILLGHSFGGKIAIYLAADDSIRAKKIVLISSAGILIPKTFMVKTKICFFKTLKVLASIPIIKEFIEPLLDIYRKKHGSSDYRNATGIMRSILVKTVNENIIHLLPKIKVPALLLWGAQDFETPLKAGEIMQEAILDSKLKIIPGGGHFPFLDNWDLVEKELDEFLD